MVNTVTLKRLRPALPDIIKDIDSRLARYIVTKRGRPVAMLISVDDYESFIETVEVLSDKNLVKRIKAAKKEIKEGRTISMESLRRKIEHA